MSFRGEIVLGMLFPMPDIFLLEKLRTIGSENGLTLYLSQLSFTFITISVMSVLSDSSNIIYWENIVDRKLIQPKWYCFYAYTTYSFATVLFGGLAALFDFSLLFMLLFIFDILILKAGILCRKINRESGLLNLIVPVFLQVKGEEITQSHLSGEELTMGILPPRTGERKGSQELN